MRNSCTDSTIIISAFIILITITLFRQYLHIIILIITLFSQYLTFSLSSLYFSKSMTNSP